ncbi:HTH-type transcriptional regulator AcrR [Mycolicibacterium vanbaalenii]|uniref:HTH-type transcriptional regulator AcrR n=1 Tax=Mycolicibacterium vanbaalenii TaxID=110539 RepID=A0A5S9RB09_MYCVN|nr:TetR family transcriptional regulator [Mycolicibacterium vanbaalenii]CAA0137593.1 HTH-type transcriptional regulator AcrR [Mycolicibacterium vanbaalenii]
MTAAGETSAARRRNASGESTRTMLMEVAERLFATRGIQAVTLREIQEAAQQSNTSVIRYHFGSRDNLIRALIAYRQNQLGPVRRELLAQIRSDGREGDPRAIVWLVVRPMADSVRAGEMYVPFLARLSENPRARRELWPENVVDDWTEDKLEGLIEATMQDLPATIRRGRVFQLYIGVINVLAESARSKRELSDVQLHNFVDGWVGMLTAPVSYETRRCIGESSDDPGHTS